MAGCSMSVVAFFLTKNAPLIIEKAWKEKIPILEDKKDLWYMWLFIILIKLLTVVLFIV
jgi:hypothetical protein